MSDEFDWDYATSWMDLPGEAPVRIVGPDDHLWCECEEGYTCPPHRPGYPGDWPPR